MSLWRILSYPFRPGPRRPLAERRPERLDRRTPQLGMEATDMTLIDKVSRANDALERTTSRGAFGFFSAGHSANQAATHIDPMPEDETYAAQYHRAFNKKGS